jgi:hypothetical protein
MRHEPGSSAHRHSPGFSEHLGGEHLGQTLQSVVSVGDRAQRHGVDHQGHPQELEQCQDGEERCSVQITAGGCVGNKRQDGGDNRDCERRTELDQTKTLRIARLPVLNSLLMAMAMLALLVTINFLIYFNSLVLITSRRFKNGFSQAINLTTFMPPKSSWSSLARLSVQTIAFLRMTNKCLMIIV